VANYYPLALLAALGMMIWMQQRHHQVTRDYASLQQMLAGIFHTAKGDAQQAFDAGDFQRAAELLDPSAAGASADSAALLLRARALECQGCFAQASDAYAALENLPGKHLAAMRGHSFCHRMASDRSTTGAPSREILYRLHEELMRRHDAASARFIAQKLLPDTRPLRDSLFALLRQLDGNIQLVVNHDGGLVDVTITRWQPQMFALLKDMHIGALNVVQAGIQDARDLAGLDIQSLNLSDNQLSDLAGLRTLPLHQLQLDYTNVADTRPLAGLPLHELHLAHTLISSLQPLALCPLRKLDISSTATRSIEALRGMELRDLDLSHTRVEDLSPLAGMPLERLSLKNTDVHDLRPISGARLKSLSLADTAIKDIDALAGMPLTELDLRGCELLSDVQALAQCPNLERVYLPRQLKAPSDRWQLPRLRFIESEQKVESAIAQK
jgi:hypothetical protein